MSSPRNILFVGAGELGLALVRAFAAYRASLPSHDPMNLTVLRSASGRRASSNDPTASELDTLHVRTIHIDIAHSSIGDLSAIFSEYDAVISCTGFSAGPGTQMKLARAAVASGVSCYVPWQWGVDYDAIGRGSVIELFDEQLDVRDYLRKEMGESGGDNRRRWLIISTGIFTSFLVLESYGIIVPASNGSGYKVKALGSWDNRVTVTCVEDIARAAVEAVCVKPHAKGIIRIAGDTVSYEDIALTAGKVTGKDVEKEEWTLGFLEDELRKDPDNGLKKYRVVFGSGKGVAWDKEDTFSYESGLQLTDLESWLRDYWAAKLN